MRKLFIGLFVSAPLFAAVQIDAEIEWGNQLFRPLVIVQEGQSAKLRQADLLIELFVEPIEAAGVRIRAEVSRVEGAKIVVLGKPMVLTRWNQPAELKMTEASQGHRFRLKVVPSKVETGADKE